MWWPGHVPARATYDEMTSHIDARATLAAMFGLTPPPHERVGNDGKPIYFDSIEIVLHDDAKREYASGPVQGLPDTKVGRFTQALYEEAKKDGWTVISMGNDWQRIFSFE
jgi:arylsulfatase A-like enzyme